MEPLLSAFENFSKVSVKSQVSQSVSSTASTVPASAEVMAGTSTLSGGR